VSPPELTTPQEGTGPPDQVPARPPGPRYICLDFETNGFSKPDAPREDWTLPWSNFPTQISVDVVQDGEIHHAFDAIISGATNLGAWAKTNVNVTMEEIRGGMPFRWVVRKLAVLLWDGDTIVAHN
jgi:hypothetical protein